MPWEQVPVSINSMLTGDQYEGIHLGISASYVSENGNALVKAGGKYYRLSV